MELTVTSESFVSLLVIFDRVNRFLDDTEILGAPGEAVLEDEGGVFTERRLVAQEIDGIINRSYALLGTQNGVGLDVAVLISVIELLTLNERVNERLRVHTSGKDLSKNHVLELGSALSLKRRFFPVLEGLGLYDWARGRSRGVGLRGNVGVGWSGMGWSVVAGEGSSGDLSDSGLFSGRSGINVGQQTPVISAGLSDGLVNGLYVCDRLVHKLGRLREISRRGPKASQHWCCLLRHTWRLEAAASPWSTRLLRIAKAAH